MNNYVTGSVIRSLREGKGMTQEQLGYRGEKILRFGRKNQSAY